MIWPAWYNPFHRARITDVITAVCDVTGFEPWQIKTPKRDRKFCVARAIVTIIAKEHGHSYPKIASYLERDHSSLCNAVSKWDAYVKLDAGNAELLAEARRVVRFTTIDGIKRLKTDVSQIVHRKLPRVVRHLKKPKEPPPFDFRAYRSQLEADPNITTDDMISMLVARHYAEGMAA